MMQSAPEVPLIVSLFEVPTITCVPAGQQDVSLPSSAVTSWVAVAFTPAELVAVQVTVVLPKGKVAGALPATLTLPQPSTAVGRASDAALQDRIVTAGETKLNVGVAPMTGVDTVTKSSWGLESVEPVLTRNVVCAFRPTPEQPT